MSPPILHSRWYEEKSWIYFYSMESLAGVAHQVEISAQQPGPATAPLQAGVAADHWSPVRRGWSSAWPQQPPSLEQILPDSSLTGDAAKPHLLPSALAPTLSRSQVQEKVEPRSNLSSPVSSQVNTKQILWINEFHSDSGEAVFMIIHNLPIVDCSRHLWKLLFQ